MSIVIIAPTRDCTPWVKRLREIDEKLEIEIYPDVADPDQVDCAIVWLYPHGELKNYPNLKLICSMGAGVDHILKDPELPDVPVARVVSERLAHSMNTYVASAVLNIHRNHEKYRQDQRSKIWDQQTFPEIDIVTGIYGFGYLGQSIGSTLQHLGFEVHGFSRSKKEFEGIQTYVTEEETTFLSKVNVLIGVLPMTEQTRGIFNYELFARLKSPAFFINIGRGNQQVEADIVRALDEGILSGAVLDVFENEPLPEESPLWLHSRVTMTPHIAGITNPEAAVPKIYENYRRLKEGKELLYIVDRAKGY